MIHKEITDKQWKSIIPHLPKPETKRQWMVLCLKMGLVPMRVENMFFVGSLFVLISLLGYHIGNLM